MRRTTPFRGVGLPKLKDMIRQKTHLKKYDTRKRNKTHPLGFALMLRTLKSRHDMNIHGEPSFYWINFRHGWKRRYRLHPVKLTNQATSLARERVMASEWGMPF
jgi:hypothetical protein